MPQALIVIPARLQASRLPGKPLKDICGAPMIVHVWAGLLNPGWDALLWQRMQKKFAMLLSKRAERLS